ncbi:MAG TPA: SDR family NAD(P)-dependent oxidoreductase [Oligoflexia bacterium]|nr:SDR family NAD(P)-dependent oxidoreductase [Oligoflexia bacterium]HMP48475.1 SDR family NAD(P)-dependent oxidoreductase [Oligoflexia bacterium]
MPRFQIDNSNIWLFGASAGIGRALSLQLAKRAGKLFISARSKDALEELKKESELAGNNSMIVLPCDAGDQQSVVDAARRIESEVPSLDIFIYNAGIYNPSDLLNFDANEYIEQMNINYSGFLRGLETVLPCMLNFGKGYVVGVSSVAAYRALPNAAAYGASKAALTYFLETLRMHVSKKGIMVSVVSPGFVKTRLTDKNDFEMPFLISPEEAANFIIKGMEAGKSEIHFPRKFSLFLKFLSILPEPLYRAIMMRFVLKDKS